MEADVKLSLYSPKEVITILNKKVWFAFAALPIILTASAAYYLMPRKERPKDNRSPCIVCIGDSITFGHGVILTRSRDAWPRILERKLNGQYEVLNFGISGATLLKEGNQPYHPDFWETAKARRAKIYILMLGTNDSKPYNWNAVQYAEQLEERTRELKTISAVEKIYLMAPPPALKKRSSDLYATFDIDPAVIQNEIRGIVKDVSDKSGVEFIDLYVELYGHSEYMPDGVHPNQRGNEVIATYLARRLTGDEPGNRVP